MSFLSQEVFTTVIDSTPLISIDLVVENEHGELLFGLRNNRPAKGFWFVPGGRILKNETLDAAFERLTKNELGVCFNRSNARLLGAWEHFYEDSVFGESPSTHYIALAYHLIVTKNHLHLPFGEQHSSYLWKEKRLASSDESIHQYSKNYIGSV
ncbi:GDP-mannose mannosyl hydrolase [Alteromonas australica]|uniref:GDP-mannose mannosyl hydrolase n=1 Tax=Alteromonas australica TaxID=589873 RepID=UPI0023545D79|nr:GDP-mannose mannosyl hydrolase [Alteromonas australica]